MSLIAGAPTVHARETWQDPSYPVFGPIDDSRNNDTVVIHYTAADDLIDGDPGEHAENLPAYMRAMQKSYVLNRGYSLGYLFAVDWLGGIWQIRGWEYQSAANLNHNAHTVPILMLVDGADGATAEAAASVRLIVAEAQRRAGVRLAIVGHGQLSGAATACPGAGLLAQIKAGAFYPSVPVTPPVPDVPVQPVEGDELMEAIFYPVPDKGVKWHNDGTPHLAIWPSGCVTRATNAHYTLAGLKSVPVLPLDSQDQYMDLVAQIGK